MKAYTGSVYVNDFNMFNRVYKVYMQAEAPYRMQKENLNMFFVKTSKGNMVPLTASVKRKIPRVPDQSSDSTCSRPLSSTVKPPRAIVPVRP